MNLPALDFGVEKTLPAFKPALVGSFKALKYLSTAALSLKVMTHGKGSFEAGHRCGQMFCSFRSFLTWLVSVLPCTSLRIRLTAINSRYLYATSYDQLQ